MEGWVEIFDLKNGRTVNGRNDNIGGRNIILHILQPNERYDILRRSPL
jgi:hypothetical protein